MADRTQRRVADHGDIAADDPFAELTRIMGFDPREPVAPRAEPRLVAVEPARDDFGDDFDIDLEKELMGEFGALDEVQEHAVAPPEAVSSGPSFAVAAPAGQHDAEMDDDLTAALEEDFRFDEDFAAEDVEPAHAAQEAFHEADDAAGDAGQAFDRAVAQALDEFGDEAEPAGEERGQASTDASFEDFEEHFDLAMAEVDMDFSAPSVEAREDVQEEAQLEAAAWPVAEAALPVDEKVEPAPAEPARAAAPDSLEDELNALLSRMSAPPAMADLADLVEDTSTPQAQTVTPEAAGADELNWALDMDSADAEDDEALEPELDAELLADLEAAGFDDVPAEDEDAAGAEAASDEDEAHFDSDAFDAALAGVMAAPEPASPVSATSDELEDPIESLKWLSSRPAPQPVVEEPVMQEPAGQEPARVWGRGTPVAPSSSRSFEPSEAPVQAEAQVEAETFAAQEPDASYGHAASVESHAEAAAEAAAEIETAAGYESAGYQEASAGYQDVPDIETVDVPERVVALADDLDIPELAFEEDQAETPAFDDLDAEFASLLSEMNSAEPVQASTARAKAYEDEPYAAGFGGHAVDQRAYADFSAAVAPVAAAGAATAFAAGAGHGGFAPQQHAAASQVPVEADPFAVTDDLDYDPDLDETMAVPTPAEAVAGGQPRGRGLLIAGIIGAVAVVGGLGALALSFGGKGADEAPAIVKADNQPIKVKPENPGGAVIPNQDNKVYDAVAKGAKPAAPAQQTLVTQAEEPVDVTAQEAEPRVVDLGGQDDPGAGATQAASQMPGAKSEDRIEPTAQAAAPSAGQEVPVVTPRKVRTMVVKPDGSLVPREEAPAEIAAAEPADPAPQHVAAPDMQDATGTVAAGDEAAAAKPAKPAAKAQSATPARAPVAPQRPSDQPVNVVGEVKPDQVASIDPGTAASGSWSVQIASQPTADSAQSTYQDLARRYASVLQGRSASIVKAEVAGKGTFYRVRVPAQSRNDAVALCNSYKAAGGNCFVSK
ncbi:MAG TPA: SPOR domain-containing protein [Mesorhizobium sp.]|nr:SPOR domain-containing protein [Mesorhizobium sp.]